MKKDNVINFPVREVDDSNLEPIDRETISTLVFNCGHSTAHLLETGEIVCSVCLSRLDGVFWHIDTGDEAN